MNEYNSDWKPPIAKPQPWHKESVAAWEASAERSEIGKKERKEIKDKHEKRHADNS